MKRYLPVRAERARSFPDCDSADVRHESLSFCAESRFEGRHSPFAGPAFRLQPSALPPPGYPDGFRQAGLRGLSQQISRSCGLERSCLRSPHRSASCFEREGPQTTELLLVSPRSVRIALLTWRLHCDSTSARRKRCFWRELPPCFCCAYTGSALVELASHFNYKAVRALRVKPALSPAGDLVRPWRGDTIPGAEFCRQAEQVILAIVDRILN